jgi:protein-S-isoprenylcysteine O-methyltransferase Ste14
MLILLALALMVGTACGAMLSFEMHTPEEKRNSWRHWVNFVGVAVVVSLAMVAAEAVNESDPPSQAVKGWCLLVLAVGAGLAYWQVTRRLQKASRGAD